MSPFAFQCAGERLEALPPGALHWPARRLLAVADLHLEKGSSYAVNALKLLPRHDTRQTLSMLSALIEALQPETVVCLGDSFHDRTAIDRLPRAERAEIERLTRRVRFVWIAGNHDPAPPPEGWGHVAVEVADSPLVFRHEALFGPADGEISGHYHPVAALTVQGRGIRRRCFLTDGRRGLCRRPQCPRPGDRPALPGRLRRAGARPRRRPPTVMAPAASRPVASGRTAGLQACLIMHERA
jgi:DNA ligase-associated metallophosphoesterase